jgi:6-phosphofructokinase 1
LTYDNFGQFLEKAIADYAKKIDFDLSVSYIDPTYAIRSVAASPADTLLCTKLAQHAVHGAMYGYTGFSIGSIRGSMAYIPVVTLMEGGINKVSLISRQWQRMIVANL